MPAIGAAAASFRKTLPLVVLSATVVSLVVVKWRAERHARGLASASSGVTAVSAVTGSLATTTPEPSLGATTPLSQRVASDNGRMLHQDPAHTHRARGRIPTSPRERWRVQLGGPVVAQAALAPDQRTVYVTSLDGTLSALDRDRKGAQRWRIDLGGRAYATPLVTSDGTIFVGSDSKKFFAIAPTGAVVWKLDVEGESDTAAVAIGTDRLAFSAGNLLYVVSTRGDVRARFRARRKIFTAPSVGPASSGEPVLYFGSQDHRAYAVRGDGALVWSTDLGADVDGGPSVADDGSIYFGTDAGRVIKLEPRGGAVLWSSPVGGFVRGAFSLSRDGSVMTGVYGPTPGLLRLAPEDGRLLGGFRIAGTGSPEFGIHGGPLEDDDGTLVFGGEDDRLYAIERSGRLRFALDRGADVDAPVTLTNDGALVVGADDGTVAELAHAD